jgi:hypothetical protein
VSSTRRGYAEREGSKGGVGPHARRAWEERRACAAWAVGWKRLGGIAAEATAWRKATTLRYRSSCSPCPMGSWSRQPGLSSSDASTRDRPGLAAQARNETRPGPDGVDKVVPNARLGRGAGDVPARCRSSTGATTGAQQSQLVQPAQHDGERPAMPSAASDEVERHPQPKRRRRERTDPLLGEGRAACGGKGMHRSCAPSGADPYPASFVPHEDGSARGAALSRTAKQQYRQKT